MRAQIVKINPKTVVIKNERGIFATIQKTKLDFDYSLGDIIILERNGDEVYFLPKNVSNLQTGVDFWSDDVGTEKNIKEKDVKEYNNDALMGGIWLIVLATIGWFVAVFICFCAALGVLKFSLSRLKEVEPDKKTIAEVLLAVGIVMWVAEILFIIGSNL